MTAAERGRNKCHLRSVVKFLLFHGSCLLDFLNKKGICVLVSFFTVLLNMCGIICRLLEERTKKIKSN